MIQLLRFAAVGVLNTGVGYAVIFACMYLVGLGAVTSNVIGYAVGLVVSYVLNRTFTFRSAAAPSRCEAARFVLTFLLAYLVNLAVLVLLIRHTVLNGGLAQIVAGGVYFGLFFVLSRYYVFADVRAANRRAT
jgi:putative flippase GtrA